MNRRFNSIIAVCILAAVTSCEPVSPSYEGTFNRLVSIVQTDDGVKLSYDPTTTSECFSGTLDNFKTVADMRRFKLNDGDRGIANISYRNLPAEKIFETTLNYVNVTRLDNLKWDGYGQDTLGTYMHFSYMQMDIDAVYSGLWNNGHVASMIFTYYPDPSLDDTDSNRIDMYLHGFKGDTLTLLAVAEAPNSRYSASNSRNSLLQYDISTLRNSGNHTADSIMSMMDAALAEKDSFVLNVRTCAKLTIANRLAQDTIKGDSMCVKLPFDF